MKNLILISEDKNFVKEFKEHFEFADEYKIFHLSYKEKEEIENFSPDLIILDISYENLKEGINILNFVKISKNIGNVPVIVISSYNDPDFLLKILKEGAEDFIEKMSDFNLIKERIKYVIKRKENENI